MPSAARGTRADANPPVPLLRSLDAPPTRVRARSTAAAARKHPMADVFVNYASFRR